MEKPLLYYQPFTAAPYNYVELSLIASTMRCYMNINLIYVCITHCIFCMLTYTDVEEDLRSIAKGEESLKMWTGNNKVLKSTVPQMLTAVLSAAADKTENEYVFLCETVCESIAGGGGG